MQPNHWLINDIDQTAIGPITLPSGMQWHSVDTVAVRAHLHDAEKLYADDTAQQVALQAASIGQNPMILAGIPPQAIWVEIDVEASELPEDVQVYDSRAGVLLMPLPNGVRASVFVMRARNSPFLLPADLIYPYKNGMVKITPSMAGDHVQARITRQAQAIAVRAMAIVRAVSYRMLDRLPTRSLDVENKKRCQQGRPLLQACQPVGLPSDPGTMEPIGWCSWGSPPEFVPILKSTGALQGLVEALGAERLAQQDSDGMDPRQKMALLIHHHLTQGRTPTFLLSWLHAHTGATALSLRVHGASLKAAIYAPPPNLDLEGIRTWLLAKQASVPG